MMRLGSQIFWRIIFSFNKAISIYNYDYSWIVSAKLHKNQDDLEGYRVSTLVNKATFDHSLAIEPLPK